MTEEWRDIPGYEGKYQVSDMGRVRSLERRVRLVTRQAGETTRRVPPRILRPGPQKSRHVTVSLGRHNSKAVHALVLLAFRGPPPAGQEGLHQDHEPNNNRLSNLRYGTRSENIRMDYVVGTRKRSLTPEDVREIRKRATKELGWGDRYKMSFEFGCNSGTIYKIIAGEAYRDVGP